MKVIHSLTTIQRNILRLGCPEVDLSFWEHTCLTALIAAGRKKEIIYRSPVSIAIFAGRRAPLIPIGKKKKISLFALALWFDR